MKLFKATVLGTVLCASFNLPAYSQELSGSCFAVSDSAIGESGRTGDALFSVNLGDFQNTSTNLGSTGTNLTEAIEYITHRDKLYYGNGTEIWVAEGPNYHQPVLCGEVAGVTDIDGMTYDTISETFFIVDRNGTGSPGGGAGGAGAPEDELLALKIDSQCNVSISAGPYNIETTEATGLADVDDIAFDPFSGKLFGIANNSNSSNTYLIEIDPSDGSLISAVAMDMPYPSYDDLEGMSFSVDGDLLVITGESAGQRSNGEGPNSSEIYSVNIETGLGSLVGDLNDSASSDRSDFESLSCGQPELCSQSHSISGFIYNEDQNAPNGLANVEIKLRDSNLNIVDIVTTNSDGIFVFADLTPGTYNYDVNEQTIPSGLIASASSEPIESELGCAPLEIEIPYRSQIAGVIGDFVWHDYCTPDGIADATELGLGLEGAPLIVQLGEQVIKNISTDSYGDYLVDGLAAGMYTVDMDLSDPLVEQFIDDQLAVQIQNTPNCPRTIKHDESDVQVLADTTTPTRITDLLAAGASNLDFDFALVESSLEVNLSSFEAESSEGQISFHWSSSSESEFSGFELELKKLNEARFDMISFIPGKGGPDLESSYEFVLNGLSPAVYQGRLKMIDTDGQFSYTNIIETEVVSSSELSVYPNPAVGSGIVQLKAAFNGKLAIKIYDQLGRSVSNLYQGAVRKGQIVTLRIDLGDFAPGVYLIESVQDGNATQRPLIISR